MGKGKQGKIIESKSPPPCPECEKLSAASSESNRIGEFLDFIEEEMGIHLAEYGLLCGNATVLKCDWQECPGFKKCEDFKEERSNTLVHTNMTKEKILAAYFNIDLDKVERERRALLNYLAGEED